MSSARARWTIVLPATALIVLCGPLLFPFPATVKAETAQANQRSLTVGILDRSDAPVSDVTIDDVIVREDGVAREIVNVAPAPPPTDLVLLVDDSQAASPAWRDLREALTAFVETMADLTPPPSIRLATFGDRPTTVVDFNPSFSAISRGIDRIVPRPGAGATLLEAIDESAGALRRRKAERPVIVAFVVEDGPEFGSLRHTNIADALKQSGASLWTLVLTARGGAGSSDAERERDIVLGDVTRQSGGRNQTVLAAQGLTTAFRTLAGQLNSRWEVTYGRPDTLIPPSRLEIEGRGPDLQVLSPQWAAE